MTTNTGVSPQTGNVSMGQVWSTWWPLAASWLMMAFELPAVSAIVARLPDPNIHLAAYGGVVFPLALVVEAPIIMLLAASTALSKDWDSYLRLRRFMGWSAALLTVIHVLVAVTPLFDLIVGDIMQAPEPIREPARIGLIIMTPWTASIAYRRFQQGVLIRFDKSRMVGIGTAVRLLANFSVLALGYVLGSWSGIVVASVAVALGVLAEAVFIGFCVKSVVRDRLRHIPLEGEPLTLGRLLRFYVPLALTSLLHLLALPIFSAGMGRMPRPIDSLATWPVMNGLIFAFRSVGLAYTEVVVALLDRPGSTKNLFRFTLLLAGTTTSLLLIITTTRLGWVWFSGISGLEPSLARLGVQALWMAVLLPGFGVFQSWFQGVLVQSHRTRGISEAVALSLLAIFSVLIAGIRSGAHPGLFVGIAAMFIGGMVQVGWLRFRSRGELERLRQRDRGHDPSPVGTGPTTRRYP
jgi:hypothetical protein